MKIALRRRFWLEIALAIITSVAFVFTLVQRDWIEVVFGIDPDHSNGTLEWLIVSSLLLVLITLSILANYEWRKARAAIF